MKKTEKGQNIFSGPYALCYSIVHRIALNPPPNPHHSQQNGEARTRWMTPTEPRNSSKYIARQSLRGHSEMGSPPSWQCPHPSNPFPSQEISPYHVSPKGERSCRYALCYWEYPFFLAKAKHGRGVKTASDALCPPEDRIQK